MRFFYFWKFIDFGVLILILPERIFQICKKIMKGGRVGCLASPHMSNLVKQFVSGKPFSKKKKKRFVFPHRPFSPTPLYNDHVVQSKIYFHCCDEQMCMAYRLDYDANMALFHHIINRTILQMSFLGKCIALRLYINLNGKPYVA